MENYLNKIDKMRVNLPPLDGGKLKYFAAVIMLIDHIACVFLENVKNYKGSSLMYSIPNGDLLDSLLRAVGRQAFPIFCFFLVEGFLKTGSRIRYFIRLLLFAVLSQFPFQKSIFPRSANFHGSVMCTLAIGMLTIWVIEAMKQAFLEKDTDRTSDAFSAGLFLFASCSSVYGFSRLAAALRTDYSYGGVILIVLMYLFQKYRIPGLFISWAWLSWYNKLELYSAPAFFMLACYNGQRGRQQKYFFYFFYPAHLLILWLLRRHFFGI